MIASDTIFFEFALVLGLVSLVGFIVYKLKLPLLVSYLLTGVLLSFIIQLKFANLNIFNFLPNLGIAFVLFLIGMELDLRELKALGKPIIISSLLQILISSVAGFTLSIVFGFNEIDSILLGIGLSFSSTVVIVKMLNERRDLASLYGKLSVGISLIEDLVAVGILMVISVIGSNSNFNIEQGLPILLLVIKAIGLFALTYLFSRYVLKNVFESISKSSELLFLTAITWCFLFTTLSLVSGFSVTIGAFLAGVALASSPYHFQIQGKIKPLRDFFVTLFFVYLGTQIRITDLFSIWPLVLIFTAYALVIKPIIFLLVLGAFGFRKHTIYQASLNLSQISEFSLVILLLGVSFGLVPPQILSVMATVAVLSVMFSSTMIAQSRWLYKYLSGFVGFFERKNVSHFLEIQGEQDLSDHIIIIGAHRIGGPIVEYLSTTKIPFLVMDFNPHVVEQLRRKNINALYGDIGDPDILDLLGLERAKLVISTATDENDNELLLLECRRRGTKAPVIVRALDRDHSKILKKMGAEFVILPEKVTGDYLTNQLKDHWPEVRFNALK